MAFEPSDPPGSQLGHSGGPPGSQAHEWVSFEDPNERRTWVFDVTWLASRYTCIWGRGCQGIYDAPTPERMEGCCSHGAHFTDGDDFKTTEKSAGLLTASNWQFKTRADRTGFFTKQKDGTVKTRVADGACIFLNRPGFSGGPGCALHAASLLRGERPMDGKPNVCWQLPLKRDDHEDQYGHVTSTIREWKRRDWGTGGDRFAWWCTESPDAYAGKAPLWQQLADEITGMVGPAVYAMLAGYFGHRSRRVWLPHPAVRAQ